MPGQRFHERRISQQRLEAFAEIALQLGRTGTALIEQCRAAIDYGQQVTQVMAGQEVAPAAPVEGFQLGGDKHWHDNQADRSAAG